MSRAGNIKFNAIDKLKIERVEVLKNEPDMGDRPVIFFRPFNRCICWGKSCQLGRQNPFEPIGWGAPTL